MVNVQKLNKRLSKYMRKLAVYQARGRVKKADKMRGRIAKIQIKLQRATARAGVTQIAVGGPISQVGMPVAAARLGVGVQRPLKVYQVSLKKGALMYQAPSGQIRTLGYTPAAAKKKYKTRRRRPRLTARDKAILLAISQNPQAAPALVMMK